MYCVLDGEVRARIVVSGRETTLATFSAGDVFGEVCLFDDGPRSADVLANQDSTLLRISADRFDRLCREQADLAAPFLPALGKTLTACFRNDNNRLGEPIALSRSSR
jgi:CRP-like cAMP-binding protein